MTLFELKAANVLIDQLDDIDADIKRAKEHLGLTLRGVYQPEELLDVVRPVLIAHFNEKRAIIVAQLKELGVTA